jgi:hypothetical protein
VLGSRIVDFILSISVAILIEYAEARRARKAS